MNLLQSFIVSPLAHAIGWTLLHSLWEGAVISGMLGAALDYIAWGPPNEMEDHANGESYVNPGEVPAQCHNPTATYSTNPFQDWYYNYIPGIGKNVKLEFVDPTGSGNYRLTFSPCEKYGSVSIGPAPR